ncbi:DUF4177 domain-containing protein [Saccharopolyspora sp. MS10]|uniref:DUF4177 domain-containing protein n=1 Tax=Saccharopolyspora sp. MS10 TaxID=3385973 RepID=UPI0039A102C5
MATWEHKVATYQQGWKGFDYDKIGAELDRFGAEGWEVVGTLTPTIGTGHTVEVGVILKRPRG